MITPEIPTETMTMFYFGIFDNSEHPSVCQSKHFHTAGENGRNCLNDKLVIEGDKSPNFIRVRSMIALAKTV